jgi:hypothetical protein
MGHRRGIEDTRRIGTAHRLTGLRSGRFRLSGGVGHQLNKISVVDLLTVEEHLLLGSGKLAVRTDTPRVRLEPFIISGIVGSEKRQRTRMAHLLLQAEIVDKMQQGGVVALVLQLCIDGFPKP